MTSSDPIKVGAAAAAAHTRMEELSIGTSLRKHWKGSGTYYGTIIDNDGEKCSVTWCDGSTTSMQLNAARKYVVTHAPAPATLPPAPPPESPGAPPDFAAPPAPATPPVRTTGKRPAAQASGRPVGWRPGDGGYKAFRGTRNDCASAAAAPREASAARDVGATAHTADQQPTSARAACAADDADPVDLPPGTRWTMPDDGKVYQIEQVAWHPQFRCTIVFYFDVAAHPNGVAGDVDMCEYSTFAEVKRWVTGQADVQRPTVIRPFVAKAVTYHVSEYEHSGRYAVEVRPDGDPHATWTRYESVRAAAEAMNVDVHQLTMHLLNSKNDGGRKYSLSTLGIAGVHPFDGHMVRYADDQALLLGPRNVPRRSADLDGKRKGGAPPAHGTTKARRRDGGQGVPFLPAPEGLRWPRLDLWFSRHGPSAHVRAPRLPSKAARKLARRPVKLSNVPPGFELTQEPACASAASAPWLPVADHEFSPGWFVRTRSYADGKRVRKAWRFGEGGRVFHVKKDALESQAGHAQDKGARTDCEAAAAASRAEAVPPNAAIETEQADAERANAPGAMADARTGKAEGQLVSASDAPLSPQQFHLKWAAIRTAIHTARLTRPKKQPVQLTVSREGIVESTFSAFSSKCRTTEAMLKPLVVKFEGEKAVDEGGPTSELFALFFAALPHHEIARASGGTPVPMFEVIEDSTSFLPKADEDCAQNAEMYALCARIVVKALIEEQPVPSKLVSSFLMDFSLGIEPMHCTKSAIALAEDLQSCGGSGNSWVKNIALGENLHQNLTMGM